MQIMKIGLVGMSALVAMVGQSQAALVTYTDRVSWEAAIGGSDYTVDFNGFSSDTSYNNSSLNVGPLTLASDGLDVFPLNTLDAPPLINTSFDLDGTSFAFSRLNGGSTSVSILFNETVSAFGGDFAFVSDDGNMYMSLSIEGGGIDIVSIPTIGSDGGFFGIVSTPSTAYTSITFGNTGLLDAWGMDNLSAKNVVVPEPGSILALLSLAGCGVGAVVVRRRRAKTLAA